MDRRQFLARAARLVLGASSLSAFAAIRLGGGRGFPLGGPARVAGADGTLGATPAPSTPVAAASPSRSPTPTPVPTPFVAPVVAENLLEGEGGWEIPDDAGRAQGYFSDVSVEAGETVSLHVSSPVPYDIAWYRLGWYAGQGARLVRTDSGLPAYQGGRPPTDRLGRVQCSWAPALTVTIPEEWVTGYYVAVLRPSGGNPSYVPLIVRPPKGGRAPVLILGAVTTWQAYNWWGGKSLYPGSSVAGITASGTRAAATVSFDRPHSQGRGSGQMLRYEYQFVRWAEREARDVEYASDLDLVRHPELLRGRRLIVLPGHPEYWSREMRDALQAQVDAGVNVAFLCANEIYWQVRFDDSPLGAMRNVTCYRSAERDPVAKSEPDRATIRWRHVGLPEARLIGQQYGHIVNRFADWVVTSSDHWIYAGTGLRDGDRIPRLIGPEYDTFFPKLAPPGTVLLAQGPVDAKPNDEIGPVKSPSIHTSTIYTAASGATVFAAGTFLWTLALDGYRGPDYREEYTPPDARVARMTKNLFDRLGDGA